MKLPYLPGAFEEDRQTILDIVHGAGTDARRKLILGESVSRLEIEISNRTGAAHAVACASGTAAMTLALDVLGVDRGDEVIVPAFCYPAVAGVVASRGAVPAFVDVDPERLVLVPEAVEDRIGPRTRAVIAAHVFSVMADMPSIRETADRHGIPVIEDAAAAQGASHDGRPAGRWGLIGVFSFFPAKTLGGIGEGGIAITDDDELATRCRMMRNHGQDGTTRFLHHLVGRNSRMDDVIAEFLLHRLRGFDERLARRADIAERYSARLAPLRDVGLVLPPAGREGRSYYVYAVLSDSRDELRAHLAEHGIETHVYWELPLPEQPAFAAFAGGDGSYPNARAAARRHLALPLHPRLSDAEVDQVADAVWSYFER